MNDTQQTNALRRQHPPSRVHHEPGDAITITDRQGRSATFVDLGTHLEISLASRAHIDPSLALRLAAALVRFAVDSRP